MDIFKVLTRSTNLNKKGTALTTNSKLPSAGSATHPQLFHDPVPESRGKKRKRTVHAVEEELALPSDDDEIDFFAPNAVKQKTAKKQNGKEEGGLKSTAQDEIVPAELLDENGCRQILRSHRLKFTLLSSRVPEKEKKSKKSKKRRDEEVTTIKKGNQKQIYPQPLQEFSELQTTYDISKRLGENLKAQGYKIPTEVQMGSLPLLLRPEIALGPSLDETESAAPENIDLLAVAPTGSGKTLAFMIPALNSIVQRRREDQSSENHDAHALEAIIVVPTKELASQIVNEGRKLAVGTGVKVVGMQKGMKVVEGAEEATIREDESASEDESDADEAEADSAGAVAVLKPAKQGSVKANILITTPLVLLHALTAASGQVLDLPSVRHLILDEADVLLDPLFKDQTLGIWNSCINPSLHVSLWSATMGASIESLATSTILDRYKRLNISYLHTIVRLVVGLKDSAVPNIKHKLIYTATEAGKLLALRQLMHPASTKSSKTPPLTLRPPFIIFTQTIPRATALHAELLYDIPLAAGGSSRIAVLHSSLSSSVRSTIMNRFRAGDIWILITTDILSRGVDFRGVNAVVNYDVPGSGAAYIHRVGRTGRAGREGGVAVTFFTEVDVPVVRGVASVIRESEKAAGRTEEGEESVPKWLLDALPKVSKHDRKELKMRGVEARRSGVGESRKGKEGAKMRISSKSGYERKVENRKKGAIEGSKRRSQLEEHGDNDDGERDTEWGGIAE